MESLVSYGSDDEGSEHYQEMKDTFTKGMNYMRRPSDDTNYDNVQMDMSEDSNNNNSSSDSEDDKSSARSSISVSSGASGSRPKPPSPLPPPVKDRFSPPSSKRSSPPAAKDKGHRDDKWSRESRKGGDRVPKDEEKDYRKEDRESSKHGREKEKARYDERPSREKSSRSERDDPRSKSRDRRSRSRERYDQPSKSQPRNKDIDVKRYRASPEHRSRSPESRHSHSKPSDICRPSRSQRDRERSKRSHSRDRQRSRSRDRQRSRSRDRPRSRSRDGPRSRSKEHRRRAYDKKINKLNVLERLGIELRAPELPPAVTPQQLLQRSIEAQVQQVKSNTGIELPKYYNPAAMNPARYAEQMQKRKLLWGNKTAKTEAPADNPTKPAAQASNNKWEGTTFAQDQDGKMTAKFKRLMGIKDPMPSASGGGSSSSTVNGAPATEGNDVLKRQEEMFNSMEMQYEVARVATHTHRGLGLGFGTFQYPR